MPSKNRTSAAAAETKRPLSELQKNILKLKRIMKRLGITAFDYDYGKDSAWVEFTITGRTQRLEHSVAQAARNKRKIKDGEEALWRIVLFIERLMLASEDGLYSFGEIVNNLPRLAPPLPEWAQFMKFTQMPATEEEVRTRYRARVHECHPDHPGGSNEALKHLDIARDQALQYVARLAR